MADAAKLLRVLFDCLATDPARCRTLMADDVTVEFPYAPSLGQPERMVGIDATFSEFVHFFENFDQVQISQVRMHPLKEEPDSVFAEAVLRATYKPSGVRFEQHLAFLVKARGGKIAMFREYFDPQVYANAFGA